MLSVEHGLAGSLQAVDAIPHSDYAYPWIADRNKIFQRDNVFAGSYRVCAVSPGHVVQEMLKTGCRRGCGGSLLPVRW